MNLCMEKGPRPGLENLQDTYQQRVNAPVLTADQIRSIKPIHLPLEAYIQDQNGKQTLQRLNPIVAGIVNIE